MNYLSKLAKEIEPYIPGEQPRDKKYIKLNTNENPYPPSPQVISAMKEATINLRLYPDPGAADLREEIARYYNLSPEEVFVGNGSDEVLAMAFMAFFNRGEEIIFPDITYSFYPVYCLLLGINYRVIPVDNSFTVKKEDYFNAHCGIVIANPNAPTGIYLPVRDIKDILKNNPEHVVLIDEAYIDFGGDSMVNYINQYPNLLVIQTLSKSRSLAGLRVGIAIGQPELIAGLNRIKNSFNSYTLSRTAQAGAKAAIMDSDYFNKKRKQIIKIREETAAKLRDLNFVVLPSLTNFLFVSHISFPAEEIFKKLRERGILVRYFKTPRIDNYLRVSVGTEKEMDILIEKLADILQGG